MRSDKEKLEDKKWRNMSWEEKIESLKSGDATLGCRALHLGDHTVPHMEVFDLKARPEKPEKVIISPLTGYDYPASSASSIMS